MKLLLTSTGLDSPAVADAFKTLAGKSMASLKILFVPTASRTDKELVYVKKSRQELIDIGVDENNILDANLDKNISPQDFPGFDVIYVCGGNTFYLLKKVMESGFDQVILDHVDKGKLYVGVSAGSILACPNIGIAAPFDENDVGLDDFSGLDMIDEAVSPHYVEDEKEIVDEFASESGLEVIRLRDGEALMVNGVKKELIR